MSPTNPSSQPNWPIGWVVHHVSETGSTNDDLYERAAAGAPERSVVVADFQTAGKGRLDRTWEAVRGTNLLCSLLFRDDSSRMHRYPRIVGLAARAACVELAGVRPEMKWPNDLVVGTRKLGGLLAVASPRDGFVVVGIGVNVGWSPSGATNLVAEAANASFSPTSEAPGAESIAPLSLLSAMLTEIDRRHPLVESQLHAEHRSALATLGLHVRVELREGATVTGIAEDIDEESRLVVRDDQGKRHVVEVGDVIHLRGR